MLRSKCSDSSFLPLSASISLSYLTGAFIALDCSPFIQRLNLPLCLCFRAICYLENSASIEYNKGKHIWCSCRGFWGFFYFIFLPFSNRSWSRCNFNFSCSDMLQLPLQQGRPRRISTQCKSAVFRDMAIKKGGSYTFEMI